MNARSELSRALDVLKGKVIPQSSTNKDAWKHPIIDAVLPVLADAWDEGHCGECTCLAMCTNPYREGN